MKKKSVIYIVALLMVSGFTACSDNVQIQSELHTPKKKGGNKKENNSAKADENLTGSPVVLERWDMPEMLTEISDIENINDQSFACIQDELGTIFIYNLQNKNIEKQIPFAGKGDYEGLTLAGTVAYAATSSGEIYEISDIHSAKPDVKRYKTFLTAKDEVEALCFDKENNRLLLAFKRKEENREKGIYSFNLKTKELEANPVYSIQIPEEVSGKKKKQIIKPSAIAINPANGDIYITEGTDPKLLILDKNGKFRSLIHLNKKLFPQPEGITFSSAGEMYISNEGKKGNGNILKVKL